MKKVTNSGVVFELVETNIGKGWKDPTGMIWYEIVKDEKGMPLKMKFDDTIKWGEENGVSLPTKKDYERLVSYFSFDIINLRKIYTYQKLKGIKEFKWSVSVYLDLYKFRPDLLRKLRLRQLRLEKE